MVANKLTGNFFKSFITLLVLVIVGCNTSDVKGTWKSQLGHKVEITEVSDETYDIKAYFPGSTDSNNPISGIYTYDQKNKKLSKTQSGEFFALIYFDNKLYIGNELGEKSDLFLTKE